MHSKKRNFILNKDIAAVSSIKEISKKLMLAFFYNVSNLKCPRKMEVQVFYGGEDSLLLKIETDNLLNDLENLRHISSRMGLSNWYESIYPELVKCHFLNQLLLLKSETGSDFISNGVLQGPKVYCIQTHNRDIKLGCKGVPTHFVKKKCRYECL